MVFFVGNSFPVSLIRRKVSMEPMEWNAFMEDLRRGNWVSFWGHENTLAAVNSLTGCNLTPREPRPALSLNADAFPVLYGQSAAECRILSPEYRPGFRPAIGKEVSTEEIMGWQVLRMEWL